MQNTRGIHVISDNELFLLAIEEILRSSNLACLRSCASRIIISDGVKMLSSVCSMRIPICGLIVFVENSGQMNLMKCVNPPFKLYFINNNSSIKYIISVITDACDSISKMKYCLMHNNPPPSWWMSPREFSVLSDSLKGMCDEHIGVRYGISCKTVQNYRKNAFNKLGLKLINRSEEKLHFLYSFIDMASDYQNKIEEKQLEDKCPASRYYYKQSNFYFPIMLN